MNEMLTDKYDELIDRYLPPQGEGENLGIQALVAVNKLLYKWWNDGDVYDNTYYLAGWCNDLSSYANWLAKYIRGAEEILDGIRVAQTYEMYEAILNRLADLVFGDEEALEGLMLMPKIGTIYKCSGPYRFEEYEDGNNYDDSDEYEYIEEEE